MVTNAHQNPSNAPRWKRRGNSSAFHAVSYSKIPCKLVFKKQWAFYIRYRTKFSIVDYRRYRSLTSKKYCCCFNHEARTLLNLEKLKICFSHRYYHCARMPTQYIRKSRSIFTPKTIATCPRKNILPVISRAPFILCKGWTHRGIFFWNQRICEHKAVASQLFSRISVICLCNLKLVMSNVFHNCDSWQLGSW